MAATWPTGAAEIAPQLERRRGADGRGSLFRALLVLSLVATLLILLALIGSMLEQGSTTLTGRLGSFLTSGFADDAGRAGVWQGLVGTTELAVIVVLVAFPLGVGSAVYLEEYAHDSRLNRIIMVNIRNLAGVPSIVYGLLGLAVFVNALGRDGSGGLTGGRTVISGGLTLAVLVLPLVIITAQEALRAVPAGIREGALALGATRWEVTRHHVLPAALPGILTGNVLALARAAGEAAPILLVGAVTGFFTAGNANVVDQVFGGSFTAMPMVIFSFAGHLGEGWDALTGAASLVLLVLIFVMNGIAVYLRNRYEQRW